MTTLLLVLGGCAYSVGSWWHDLAEARCSCSEPGDVSGCVDRALAELDSEPAWQACQDQPAPVSRSEVRRWVDDYTDDCRAATEPFPAPDSDSWTRDCASGR